MYVEPPKNTDMHSAGFSLCDHKIIMRYGKVLATPTDRKKDAIGHVLLMKYANRETSQKVLQVEKDDGWGGLLSAVQMSIIAPRITVSAGLGWSG